MRARTSNTSNKKKKRPPSQPAKRKSARVARKPESLRTTKSDSRIVTLKNIRAQARKAIQNARLEKFKNPSTAHRYHVEMTINEFTCLCPVSGFPDFATLRIDYVPRDWCVELKSLKLYINQYRDRGIFHEEVPNTIMQALIDLLDPWEIKVEGDFNVRGNIKTVVKSNYERI